MLKAGFARLDVTPPLGSPLTGYYRNRYADGVLDPIELCALALDDGASQKLIVTVDFCYVGEKVCIELRDRIAKATGVPADGIQIHSLHQHTSIHLSGKPCMLYVDYIQDPMYFDVLYRKFEDAAKMALDDLHPAALSVAEAETPEPLSFVRRYVMKDGSIRTNPGSLNPDIVRPADKSDNAVRLMRFTREGAGDI
ncbi:MAG: hypothetical protein IKQ87_00085, partial [Clostridia bacterium]|nr:hypothetical protein [Clostridia bacterium]